MKNIREYIARIFTRSLSVVAGWGKWIMRKAASHFSFSPAQIEWVLLAVFAFMAFGYIVGSSYLGISGSHTFRQSDVYSSILAFANMKDIAYHQRFIADIAPFVYNIPIYEYLIGKAALLTERDPLVVTRYFNVVFWLLTAYAGYRLCRGFGPAVSGVVFVFLLSASPLILHYYSVPLPDSMGIALSLIGILLLHRFGNGWRGVLWAVPFLVTATIMKSPIPFFFVVFYVTYLVINLKFPDGVSLEVMLKSVPLITLLSILLFGALFAERVRVTVSDSQEAGIFAQPPGFYFGQWGVRASWNLWSEMVGRFGDWFPGFGMLYLLTVITASLLKFERRHLAMTAAAVVTVVIAWFVFPNRHLFHDYYQMSIAIIIFMSFAVSFSHILLWVRDRLPAGIRGGSPVAAAAVLILLSFYMAVWPYKPISGKSRINIHESIEYALRDEVIFLFVNTGRAVWDPYPGGYVSTKFFRVTHEEFEANCEDYLNEYAAVFLDGRRQSECLAGNRQNAVYYIEDDGIIFYMR